jgi:antitoxin VapB
MAGEKIRIDHDVALVEERWGECDMGRSAGGQDREAVMRALAERLERVSSESGGSLANRLLAIGTDCAGDLKEPYRSVDHGELLYDDLGLPR